MRCSALVCVAILGASCSDSVPGREQLRSPSRGASSASAGTRSGAAGPNSFGTDSPTDVIPIAGSGEPTGNANSDGGTCQVGKFCGPAGPDPNNCGTLRLEQDVKITRQPGNVLIIFDQSLSMNDPWNNTTKVLAANDAVTKAVTTLQDLLTVGAIFFPTLGCAPGLPGVAVDPIESQNQISFRPGAMFLNAWNAHWMTVGGAVGFGTPMQEAFDRADGAIQNAKLTGPLAVVVFTDGAPNCGPDPQMTGVPTMLEPDRAASWRTSKMISTYVVGLPGADGVQLLNDVAVKGGTMQYILPDDPAQLEQKLREVVSQTVRTGFDSCSITLTPAANPVDKLLMIVEEGGKRQRVEHMLGANAGWTISADGMNVELFGTLCDDAKAGRFESITFEYGCPDVPPPPALPGPQ